MPKHAPSKASERHSVAVSEKHKLLTEIQHWLESTSNCIADIKDTISTLNNARALAKRDIHMARSNMEKKLKELETDAELQMSTMVEAEEETLVRSQKKLVDQKQKLESAEASLQKNCAGLELGKHIEEAKSRLAETRQSIITSKRQHRPFVAEFNIHEELIPFVNGERSLGKVLIKSTKGVIIRSSEHDKAITRAEDTKVKTSGQRANKDGSSTTPNGIPVRNENPQRNNKRTINARFDRTNNDEPPRQPDVTDQQPVFSEANSARVPELALRKHIKDPHDLQTVTVRHSNHEQAVKIVPGAKENNLKQRCTSAYTRNKPKTGEIIDVRISTSAREDSRTLPKPERHDVKPVMKFLNNIDHVSYGEHQEQTAKKSKKEKRNVRYAEYNTIKEITMVREDALSESPYIHVLDGSNDAFVFPEHWRGIRTASGSSKGSNNSLSSIGYKTSNSSKHGSLSDTWQSKIYSGSHTTSPSSISYKPSGPTFNVQRQVPISDNLHTKSFSGSSNASLSSISYKPPSAHSSGSKHVSLSDTWQSKSFFAYTARFHTKKHPEDTDLCRLTGIVVLSNGQIVISDINHLRVMLFGPDYTYLSDIECPSPCGLCLVQNEIVAVTLFHNRKILLLKVCMLHLKRHKELPVHCPETLYSVKYSEGYFYVLCFGGHIHVVDNSGKHVRVIETGFESGLARNLELDGVRKVLYVSSQDHVTCFLNSGNICWQFTAKTSSKTFSPGGINLHNDRLFVTDWGNHRVLEISLDGTFVRDVITDNLEFPHAMTVQQSTGSMFITQSSMFRQEARSRSVKVFNIK